MGISIDGLASGLDTTGIINKLMELERRPIEKLVIKQAKIDDQLVAWQEINKKILAFETVATEMNTSTKFKALSSTFTNANSVQQQEVAQITVDQNLASASYNFKVNQLATSTKLVSNEAFSSTGANIPNLTMTITTAAGDTVITGATTLDDVVTKINNSGLGLTALLINISGANNPSYRLQVASSATGVDTNFSIGFTQALGFGGLVPLQLNFSTSQTGQDAIVEIDGIQATRDSNTFDDLLEGVSFDLKTAGSGTVTLESDFDELISNVQDFVGAYNDVMDEIKKYDFYNISTKEKGVLYGNSTARGVMGRLKNIITNTIGTVSAGSGHFSALSQVGVKTDATNRLTVDEAKLQSALETNINAVTNLFVSSGSGTYEFVSATGGTIDTRYDTRVTTDSNGALIIEMLRAGTSNWITMTRSGNFLRGSPGSNIEGLIIRAPESTLTYGETGYMRPVIGIAERIRYQTAYMTEYSRSGAIFNERKHLEALNEEYDKETAYMEERLATKQANLKHRYAQLEVLMSKLKGQSDYLSAQLGSFQKTMKI
jgi:flagellar hook-associated protein 2